MTLNPNARVKPNLLRAICREKRNKLHNSDPDLVWGKTYNEDKMLRIDNNMIRQKQRAFILDSIDPQNKDAILKIFDDISAVYHSWDPDIITDVEISVKITPEKINYNRYTIPIFKQYLINEKTREFDPHKVDQILRIMEIPAGLYSQIMNFHVPKKEALILGIDFDNNFKKIYFIDNLTKELTYYGFINSTGYNCKFYRTINKNDYNIVLDTLKKTVNSNELLNNVLKIMPYDNWFFVLDEKDFQTNEAGICYHMATLESHQISKIKEFLINILNYLSPKIDKQKFIWWLKKNLSHHLYVLSVGANKNNITEVTLYLRRCPKFVR
jgi:hypothetical protein